jgi:hypothetical protein
MDRRMRKCERNDDEKMKTGKNRRISRIVGLRENNFWKYKVSSRIS